METFSTPHLHVDILLTPARLSDSNPRDEVVALEEVQVGGMGRWRVEAAACPTAAGCEPTCAARPTGSWQVTRSEGGPQSHRQGLG